MVSNLGKKRLFVVSLKTASCFPRKRCRTSVKTFTPQSQSIPIPSSSHTMNGLGGEWKMIKHDGIIGWYAYTIRVQNVGINNEQWETVEQYEPIFDGETEQDAKERVRGDENELNKNP